MILVIHTKIKKISKEVTANLLAGPIAPRCYDRPALELWSLT
jgi:hypothetical protein